MLPGLIRAAQLFVATASALVVTLPPAPAAAVPPGPPQPGMLLFADPLAVSGQSFQIRYGSRLGGDPYPGVAYVRNDTQQSYTGVPLAAATDGEGGPVAVGRVPAALVRGSRLYFYAVFEIGTVPPAGAAAPDVAYIINRPVQVPLGTHDFAHPTVPAATVAHAPSSDLGFDLSASRLGPSGFDVTADGRIWVLDEVKDRILVWDPGRSDQFARAVAIPPASDDFAVSPGGTIYVTGREHSDALYALSPTGTVRWHAPINSGGRLQIAPTGVVYVISGDEWMPVTTPQGQPLPLDQQVPLPRCVQPLDSGRLVVTTHSGTQTRVAVLGGAGRTLRGWQITSADRIHPPFVSTATTLGGDVVVPLTVDREKPDGSTLTDLVVLRLGDSGLSANLHFPATWWGDWPTTTLRVGPDGAVYQMQLSYTAGVTVVRYQLPGAHTATSPAPSASVVSPVPTPGVSTDAAAPAGSSPGDGSPSWLLIVAGVAAAAGGAALALWWLWHRHNTHAPPSTMTPAPSG